MRRLALAAFFVLLVFSDSWMPVSAEFGEPIVETQEAVSIELPEMENANFLKRSTVTADRAYGSDNITEIFVRVPGRVIINHVENATATADFGIDVYADTAELADQVSLGGYLLVNNRMYIFFDSSNGTEVDTGYLLVEISVYLRNSIKYVQIERDASGGQSTEMIVNDGVLYSNPVTPTFTTDSSGYIDYEDEVGTSDFAYEDEVSILASGGSAIYVFSESPLNVYKFDSSAMDTASVYVEATAIAAVGEVKFSAHDSAKSIAVVESLQATSMSVYATATDSICLYVTDTFETGDFNFVVNKENFVVPGKQSSSLEAGGSFTCTKAVVPDRALRDITLSSATLTASDEKIELTSGSSNGAGSTSSSNGAYKPSLVLAFAALATAAAFSV